MAKTIILLEDNEIELVLYGRWLEKRGYQVVRQPNSKGIVTLIERYRPALIITDLMMPGASGVEGIQKIVTHHSVPIIAMSSRSEYLQAINEFVAACLLKPLSDVRLLAEVDRILGTNDR